MLTFAGVKAALPDSNFYVYPKDTVELLGTCLLDPQSCLLLGHRQSGKTLMCRAGLDREKVALSQQTALQGAKVVAFPTPAPPFSDGVDCVIVVGS